MLLEWKDRLGTGRFLGCLCQWVNSGTPVLGLNPETSGFHVKASLSFCPDLSTLCQLLIAPPLFLQVPWFGRCSPWSPLVVITDGCSQCLLCRSEEATEAGSEPESAAGPLLPDPLLLPRLSPLEGLCPGESLESLNGRNPEMPASPGCVSPLPLPSLQDSGGIIS